MTRQTDFQRIGDLVWLCAQTMKLISADTRAKGIDCPFKPCVLELEQISRDIRSIVDRLPAAWDGETSVPLS